MNDSVTLSKIQAMEIMRALDAARDAVQCITRPQLILHRINPNTATMLDDAMDVLGPALGLKEQPI